MLSTRSYFDDFFRDIEQNNLVNRGHTTSWHHMKLDVMEKPDKVEVIADLPGVSKQDIDVKLDHNVLKIRAERKEETERADANTIVTERKFGSLERSLLLPESCDATGAAEASFENGVLKLCFPKKKETDQGIKKISIG
eukprot:NODE_153_length_15389_cov_1.201439.p16 type:complete len:139 gc:universal NODE_153_length_15389_cov_1.201439:1729-2145(+)